MFVCCECCVLSGLGLCDGLITHPEEFYRLWCVIVCDLETSWMRRPRPTGGAVVPNRKKLAWCWLIFQEYRIFYLLSLHNWQPVLSHIVNFCHSYSFSALVLLRLGVQVPSILAFLLSCPVKTCYRKVMYKVTTSLTRAVFLNPCCSQHYENWTVTGVSFPVHCITMWGDRIICNELVLPILAAKQNNCSPLTWTLPVTFCVSAKIPTPTIVLCFDTKCYFCNVLKSVILFCGSLVSHTFSKIILHFFNLSVTFSFHWIHIKGKEIKIGIILFQIMLIFQSVINASNSCINISEFILFQWFNLYGMMMMMMMMIIIILFLHVLDCTIFTRIFNFYENLLTEYVQLCAQ
jgi:hypothetical protein